MFGSVADSARFRSRATRLCGGVRHTVRGERGRGLPDTFGLILGAAFAAGKQTQSFSQGASCHYDQDDQAISLYTAYKYGPVWGNAVASTASTKTKISRSVPLGMFMDQNSTGNSLSLALRLGTKKKWFLFHHG